MDFYRFLEIYFVYFGHNVMYNIFKDMLYNLTFISHILLFNAETSYFLLKKYSLFHVACAKN